MKINELYPKNNEDRLRKFALEKTNKTFKNSKIKNILITKKHVIVKLILCDVQWIKEELLEEMKLTNTKQV